MTIEVLERPAGESAAESDTRIADCDIHPSPKSLEREIYPFLEKRWQRHLERYGARPRQPFLNGPAYPKGQPDAARRDAYPPAGGRPGSDLAFMRAQHLDPNNVGFGVLNPLKSGQGLQNLDFADAYCRAINDWQIAFWTREEPRLKASIVVPYEDTAASVREIERCAGEEDYVQVFMLNRTAEPMGQRRYWPIYDAAAAAGLPLAVHAFGFGGAPITGGGWPSYYIEDMTGHAQSSQAALTSMVFEGVFDRLPSLRMVLIESGFAWLPALCWRLDRVWARMRDELHRCKRRPSETIHEQVFLTTQPMEEPRRPRQLLDCIEWIGWDRLLFATDYPHWDFDRPDRVLPPSVDAGKRRAFFRDNALKVYGRQMP